MKRKPPTEFDLWTNQESRDLDREIVARRRAGQVDPATNRPAYSDRRCLAVPPRRSVNRAPHERCRRPATIQSDFCVNHQQWVGHVAIISPDDGTESGNCAAIPSDDFLVP